MNERIIIIIITIPQVESLTCVCHAANCLAGYVCIQARGKYGGGESGMDVRPSGGQPDGDFCLGAVDSANKVALDAQKSRDGVCEEAKISMGEAPVVCQAFCRARRLILAKRITS